METIGAAKTVEDKDAEKENLWMICLIDGKRKTCWGFELQIWNRMVNFGSTKAYQSTTSINFGLLQHHTYWKQCMEYVTGTAKRTQLNWCQCSVHLACCNKFVWLAEWNWWYWNSSQIIYIYIYGSARSWKTLYGCNILCRKHSRSAVATRLSRAKEPTVKGPYNIKLSCLFTFYMNEMLLNCVNTVYIHTYIYIYVCIHNLQSCWLP